MEVEKILGFKSAKFRLIEDTNIPEDTIVGIKRGAKVVAGTMSMSFDFSGLVDAIGRASASMKVFTDRLAAKVAWNDPWTQGAFHHLAWSERPSVRKLEQALAKEAFLRGGISIYKANEIGRGSVFSGALQRQVLSREAHCQIRERVVAIRGW